MTEAQSINLLLLKVHDFDKTILVMDEMEAILNQMASSTMSSVDLIKHWMVLEKLLRNSSKVIAMSWTP